VGQHAHDLVEAQLGVEGVEPAGRDNGEDSGNALGVRHEDLTGRLDPHSGRHEPAAAHPSPTSAGSYFTVAHIIFA
jgi:hypothetical protein